jgi:hypothetical protein
VNFFVGYLKTDKKNPIFLREFRYFHVCSLQTDRNITKTPQGNWAHTGKFQFQIVKHSLSWSGIIRFRGYLCPIISMEACK